MKTEKDNKKDLSYDECHQRCWERMLEWRNIEPENVCHECNGSGKKSYASTSTWCGEWGASAITIDVCNKCWGSGDNKNIWTNLRNLNT